MSRITRAGRTPHTSHKKIQNPTKTALKKANLAGRTACLSTGGKIGCAVGALAVLGAASWYVYNRLQSPIAMPTLQLNLLATHMHPGLQIVADGGCVIPSSDLNTLKSEAQCVKGLNHIKRGLHGLESQIYIPSAYNNKGVEVMDQDTLEHYVVGMNPAIRKSYKNGLVYAQAEMKSPGFFNRSTEEIVAVWKTIHKKISQFNDYLKPGQYRQSCPVIFKEGPPGVSAEKLRVLQLNAAGASEDDIHYIMEILSLKISACALPERAKTILSKIAGVSAPAPGEVPGQMESLINRIKDWIKSDTDPIKIGAEVHQELVRIHPWSDANGRFARLIMNMMLPEPVVFPNDAEYTDAVSHAIDGLTSFEGYLRDKVIPWNKLAQSILIKL